MLTIVVMMVVVLVLMVMILRAFHHFRIDHTTAGTLPEQRAKLGKSSLNDGKKRNVTFSSLVS